MAFTSVREADMANTFFATLLPLHKVFGHAKSLVEDWGSESTFAEENQSAHAAEEDKLPWCVRTTKLWPRK